MLPHCPLGSAHTAVYTHITCSHSQKSKHTYSCYHTPTPKDTEDSYTHKMHTKTHRHIPVEKHTFKLLKIYFSFMCVSICLHVILVDKVPWNPEEGTVRELEI